MSVARQLRRAALFAVSSILIPGALLAQSPGALDETFGGTARARVNFSDKVLTNAGGWDAVVQAPNNPADPNYRKIVLVGQSAEGTRPHFAVVRLNINGTRDMGFGPDGAEGAVKEIDLGTWDTLTDVAMQSDNKIVVLGYISQVSNVEDWRLIRYTANGERDTTFGNGNPKNGLVTFNVNTNNAARTKALAIDSQGRIYAVGYNTPQNANSDMLIYRLNTNGTFDSTWGTGGLVTLALNTPGSNKDEAWGIGIQSTGKVVIAGRSGNKPIVLRLNTNGTLDTTFGTSGQTLLPTGGSVDYFRGMTVDSQDRILAVGKYTETVCQNITNRGMVARFTANGAIDTTFSGGDATPGYAGQPAGRVSNYEDVEVDPQGRIVVTGQTDFSWCNSSGQMGPTDYQIAAFRFTTDGAPDPSFVYPAGGSAGAAYINVLDGQHEQSHGIALQPDGDILVPSEGYALNLQHMMCVRFNGTDGTLDTTFNTNGQVLTSSINKPGVFATRLYGGSADYSYGTAVQADGKTVLVGQTWNGWDYDFAVSRLTTAGILDLTFGGDDPDYDDASRRTGKFIHDVGSAGIQDREDYAFAVAIQSDGKIVVAGTSNAIGGSNETRLFRLTTSGAIDTSFGTSGFTTTNFAAGGQRPRSIVIEPVTNKIFLTGEVYAGGYSNLLLARYSANGTMELSATPNYQNGSNFEEGHAIALQPDGKVVIGGKFQAPGGKAHFYVGRFSQAFVADSTFALGRIYQNGVIVADPLYQGVFPIPHETRPTPTAGNTNPTGTSISASDEAKYVVVEPDGRITLGGRTIPLTANARPRYGLTRLTASGWIDPTFGTNGWVSTYFPGGAEDNQNDSDIYALLKQNDGKLIGLGTAGTLTNYDFAAARYNWDDGSLDTAFGTGGKKTIAVGAGHDFGYSGMMASDGKIVIGGYDYIREDFIAGRWQGDGLPSGAPNNAPDLTTDSSRANYAGTADDRTNVNNPTFGGSPCVVGQSIITQVINTGTNVEHLYKARHLCRSTADYAATVPKYSASGGGFVGFLPDGTYKVAAYAATGGGSTALSPFLSNIIIDTVSAVPTQAAPTELQKMNAEQAITFSGGGVEEKSDVYVFDTTGVTWNAQTGNIATGSPVKICTSFLSPAAGTWTCQTPAHPDPAALALGLHKVKVQQEDIAANTSVICVTGSQSGPGCANERQFYVKANTTASAFSDADSQTVYGEPVTFTTTITTNVGKPDGTVVQTYDNVNIPPVAGTPVVPCATTDCHTSTVTHAPTMPMSVGTHTYAGAYAETVKYFGSNTPVLTHTVIKADTTTSLVSSAPGAVFGQPITITPTIGVVAPGAGTPTGSLRITIDNGTPTTQNNLGTFSANGLAVGTHSIKVEYLGDGNFNPSEVTLEQIVVRAATSTALISSSNPSIFDGSVTFTATISVTSPGAGSPSGGVTFKDAGTTIGTGTLDAQFKATMSTTQLLGGSHSITAEYSGDTSFVESTSSTLSQTVNTKATTTTLSSSANPSESGDSVTITATVNDTRATGTVEFFDNVVTSLGTQPVTAGVASLSTADLTPGMHPITAVFSGDTNFSTSTALELVQEVKRLVSTVVLTSSATPVSFGTEITLTATLGDNRGTGNVIFRSGATDLATVALVNGVATYQNTTLPVGTASLTAHYEGDVKFLPGTSDPIEQVITQAISTLALTTSQTPTTYGVPVTFTATVSNSGASGSINFKDASGSIGTGVIAAGVATLTTSTMTVGSHVITAEYAGDTNVAGSTSDPVTQVVDFGTPTVALSSSANPSSYGDSVTFTATLSAGATGTVTFKNGAVELGSSALVANVATFTTSALTADTHSITAAYSGDTNYTAGTSTPLSQVVNKLATQTTVTSSDNPSIVEGSVTFTANVAVVAPGTGTPTGSVTFVIDGAETIVALTNGSATHTVSTLSVGTHTVAVNYGSDAIFAVSSGTLLGDQVVDKGSATVAVATSANPSPLGGSITFTATLTPVAPTSTAPTGSVTFLDGVTSIGSGTVVGGVATITTSSLLGGSHTITAQYSGDSLYATSSGTLNPDQMIGQGGSSISLSSSSNPGVFGDTITFTAAVTDSTGLVVTPPTGTIAFSNGATPLATVPLDGNGVATFSTSALTMSTHTINAAYSGDASYTANNASLMQVVGNDIAPVAVDDAFSTAKNITLIEGNVLSNDSDANGDALSASLVGNASTGTLNLNADGTFTYVPPLDFMGQVTFTYDAVSRGLHSTTAVVTITVTPSAPRVTAITPNSGDNAGGTVTITGTQFYPGASVTIGGQSVIATIDSDTTITTTVPVLAAGTLNDVVVTNTDTGSGTGHGLYVQNFLDVKETDPIQPFVEKMFRRRVTSGCGLGKFCIGNPVTRQEMAVFLLKAKYGPTYLAPNPPPKPIFTDVPANSPFKPWVERLAVEKITSGCGPTTFCPTSEVSREQSAVFLLVAREGLNYNPPPATVVLLDVPLSSPFARWIQQLYIRNVTNGCAPDYFCPQNSILRGQVAVWMTQIWGW